jgi:hypothetical protein
MTSLVWLHSVDGIHTYGLECMSNESNSAEIIESFVYAQVKPLCVNLDVNYFIQGYSSNLHSPSWAFVEFFGEGDQNKIIKLIDEFNKMFGGLYYGKEVQMQEPSRNQLIHLGLI